MNLGNQISLFNSLSLELNPVKTYGLVVDKKVMLLYFSIVVMKFIQAMKSILELVVDKTYGVMHHMALLKKKFDFPN